MSTGIPEWWINDVAASIRLPALSPSAISSLSICVEERVRRVAQLANTFRRRCKSSKITVDDVNMAL